MYYFVGFFFFRNLKEKQNNFEITACLLIAIQLTILIIKSIPFLVYSIEEVLFLHLDPLMGRMISELVVPFQLLLMVALSLASPNDHRYNIGDEVPLFVNKVGPLNNPRYPSNWFFFLLSLWHFLLRNVVKISVLYTVEILLIAENVFLSPQVDPGCLNADTL